MNENTKREYLPIECIFAWISLIAGYLFCRFFPAIENPLAALICSVLIFAVTATVVIIRGGKIKGMPLFAVLSSILLLTSLFFSSNKVIQFFSSLYAVLSYMYFISASFNNTVSKDYSNFIVADYFKALFVAPFCSLTDLFSALFYGKGKERAKVILKVLLGIAIAFIPTIIVMLLLSYDNDFVNILESVFRFDFLTVFINILSIMFGIPIGMYIYGAFISSVDKKCDEILPKEKVIKTVKDIQLVSWVTSLTAAIPLLFLYVIFFVSQFKYYVSGFVGVLPDSQSYAEYARKGFFELCAVAVINLMVIIAINLFMKRDNKGTRLVLKLLSILYSLSTLILVSTAIAKMVLYINRFGLTPKRVYASWFMIFLSVIFVFIIIKQIAGRFKIIPVSLIVTVAMFAVVALGTTEQFIAKYNVNRYISGSLETVDVSALTDLGDSAVPQLVRLAKHFDKQNKTDIKATIEDESLIEKYSNEYIEYSEVAQALKDFKNQKSSFKKLTLPKILAQKAVKSL